MPGDVQEQLIKRAQRYPREKPLVAHYIIPYYTVDQFKDWDIGKKEAGKSDEMKAKFVERLNRGIDPPQYKPYVEGRDGGRIISYVKKRVLRGDYLGMLSNLLLNDRKIKAQVKRVKTQFKKQCVEAVQLNSLPDFVEQDHHGTKRPASAKSNNGAPLDTRTKRQRK